MIIKESDGVSADIDRLQALSDHPNADTRTRMKIDEQIRMLKAGDRGEASAFYHINTYFGASKNWAVIHDLRIEHEGNVAQIDHLLIGRLLDVWVCESKNAQNGIRINEFGEFTTYGFDRRPRAMASPIEQNERHIHVLKALVAAGAVQMPRRLGLTLKPRFRSAVLIANGTISRPKVPIPGLEVVMKTEQFRQRITSHDDAGNPLDLAKLVASETIADIGRQLAALHRPIAFDWEKRLGLHEPMKARDTAAPVRPRASKPVVAVVPKVEPEVVAAEARAVKKAVPAAGACAACGAAVSRGVRTFCEKNEERFGGAVYCMTCQPGVGATG